MRFQVDVSVVVYRQESQALSRLLDSLAAQRVDEDVQLRVLVSNNDPADADRLDLFFQGCAHYPFEIIFVHSPANVGFGAASEAPFFLILNPDAWLHSTAFQALRAAINMSPETVAAWELRQLPYEHPKVYNPSTLSVDWISGAAALFRRGAFASVQGFDPRIFLYGEDVDLSWRLRASGWTLRYVPSAVAVHLTYACAAEVKPTQVVNGVLASLYLRTRFGSFGAILRGLGCWCLELARPARFAGARRAQFAALPRYFANAAYFRKTGRTYRESGFQPEFRFWGYSDVREGAFFEFRVDEIAPHDVPLVSIIVRTYRRPALLREALWSLVNQTYPRVEVVVVEDGPDNSRSLVESEFKGRLNVRYLSTGVPVGRSAAGNRALALASGEWFGFLDDDDQFFADHVQTLMQAVEGTSYRAVYGAAHEIPTEILDLSGPCAHYVEGRAVTKYRPYSRLAMWQENLAPIQAILFHRSLWKEFGGFDEDLDQLEDWVLWVRYSCVTDFLSVKRVTSRYRVPMSAKVALERQAKLHDAYVTALARQRSMRVTLSPRDVTEMAEEQAKRQAIIHISRTHARQLMTRMPFLRKLMSSQSAWRRGLSNVRRAIWPRS